MEKQQFTKLEDISQEIIHETEYPEQDNTEIEIEEIKTEKDPQTIILRVDENSEEGSIDLLNVMSNMGKRFRMFRYLLLIAVCAGFLAAAAITGFKGMSGEGSYASAVVVFSFDGIDEGLDPNGGLFDVNKMKSTPVIHDALAELGWSNQDVEEIRSNVKLEGVIPDSVKQQISVINTVAEDAAEYYTNIEDLNYFPSRYTVTLKKCKGMTGSETRELLDAILISYKQFFMDSYADTSVLGTAMMVLDVKSYDYLQAADMIENTMDTMQTYVNSKQVQAPDFRANSTGLSFSDLARSVEAVKQLDLNNFISFVQSNNLTKDAGTQIDYYNYQIKQYNLEIQELQSQLSDVERTIAGYEKDPVIVMSNQDSVTETSRKNEYYDELLERKLTLNQKISSLNTEMNKAYEVAVSLNSEISVAKQEDYEYADSLLQGLLNTVDAWSELVQKTAEEYYEAELYDGAYRISIPAQYSSVGGMGDLIKMMAVCSGTGVLIVMILWGAVGMKDEITRMRRYETYTDSFSELD